MKHTKTYAGAAVFFERLADDGWPEDGGEWPERCALQTHPVTHSTESLSLQNGRRLTPMQFLKSLLWSRKRA